MLCMKRKPNEHEEFESWEVLTTFLPRQWQEKARATGALRRTRVFQNAETLLRTLLLHLGLGFSLSRTSRGLEAAIGFNVMVQVGLCS